MTDVKTKCLICSCEGTMAPDAAALAAATGMEVAPLHTLLCRRQLGSFERALGEGGPLVVACTAEAPLFEEVAGEAGRGGTVRFVNIRETAGWSDEAAEAGPKMAALLAGAAVRGEPAGLKAVESDGLCLVYGAGQPAMEAAKLLAPRLSVTLLMSDPGDVMLGGTAAVPIYRGRVVRAEGSFGKFSVTVDGYAPLKPSARGAPVFEAARDGAVSECSLILDLSGGTPLVTGARHRDGYFRADPGDPAAVLRAVLAASDMVGSFEKPIYVDYNADTCAHSRSTKVGCTKCLDACPAGAIVSLGDPGIAIDAGICGGCGACAAGCPTGSISYRYPRREDMIACGQAMLGTYFAAGGVADPVLLVHDGVQGAAVIDALARYGRGLPARVLPLETHKPTQLGHVEMAALFAAGAARIVFLLAPEDRDETAPLEAECALIGAVLDGLGLEGPARTSVVVSADPDVLDADLREGARPAALKPAPFAALGSKRDIARTGFAALARQVPAAPELIALPEGAPYGRIDIDVAACTLCMACTSACPAAAVIDTPGEPRLRFVESACVQCGLCVSTCPENALSLAPRLNLAPAAMAPETLKEEEPFECVSCGKPFATRSTIARIKEQLAGKHAMFATPEKARMIEMCDTCRIEHQANSTDDPFAMGTRPRMRTTDDDLARRAAGTLDPDDFIIGDE